MQYRTLEISVRKEGDKVCGRFRASKWFMDFLREATWSEEEKPIVIRTKYGDCKIYARSKDSYEIFGVWPSGLDVIEAAGYLPEIEKAFQAGQKGLLEKMQAIYGVKKEEPKAQPSIQFLPVKVKGTLHLPVKPAEVSRITELAQRLNSKFGHPQNKRLSTSIVVA